MHPALFRGTQHPSGALDLIMWLNPVPIPVEDRRLRCPYSMAIRKSHTLGHIFAKYVLLTVFDKLRMTSGFSVTNFNIFSIFQSGSHTRQSTKFIKDFNALF